MIFASLAFSITISPRVLCFRNFLLPWGGRERPWEGVDFGVHQVLGLNPSSAVCSCVALATYLTFLSLLSSVLTAV